MVATDCGGPLEDLFPTQNVEADIQPDEVVDLESFRRGGFLRKIRFAWRHEDQAILDQIEGTAADMISDLFDEAIAEVDRFYEVLRIPVYRNGARVLDAKDRQVWKTENGRPVEDWDQLTGQDIEQILMNLQRLKMSISMDVNRLKNQAIYAKMAATDIKDDNWDKMDGRVGDKEAHVNIQSRSDRYHFFFRYYLWSCADTLLREIIDFMFRLKDVRYWRIQSQER